MTDDRGCFRNRVLSGGGSTSYGFGPALLAPGIAANNTTGVLIDVGCGSAGRPMVSASGPSGLPGMGGGRRRRRRRASRGRKTARKQHGGRYGFDLAPQMAGQGYAPNQFAAVVGMRGETCTPFNRGGAQMGGAMALSPANVGAPPTLTASPGSYQSFMEAGTAGYTPVMPAGQGVNPFMINQPVNALQMSGACLKTGGRRKSRRARKASRKGRKSRRSSRK